MHSPVEEIKNRLSIEEVIGSYIELRPFGKTQKALCPFHREKTPSFAVSEERQSFYCFGCNKGGDMFTFVEEFEGVDFRGALKILADKAGVDINEYQGDTHKVEEKNILYGILRDATEIYARELKVSEEALNCVKRRGINEESVSDFELGYAPESWSFILDSLTEKGYDTKLIEEAGLIITKNGGGHYDRFRNRVMFPISDSSGRTIGFSGRTLSSDDSVAKYINSPETAVFKKRDVLFGMHKAKQHIRRLDFSILVEGQMDLVLSHQAGFRNTIATSGTALTERDESASGSITNLELAKRLSRNIVIAFDSDKAGSLASVKNARIAFALGMDVKIATLPEAKDPADVILSSQDEWRKIIKNSRDVVEFQLQEIELNAKDKKDVLKKVRTELFKTIRAIPSALEREHYLNLIADKLGMRAGTIFEEFLSTSESARNKTITQKEATTKDIDTQKINPATREELYLANLIELEGRESSTENSEEFSRIFGVTPKEYLSSVDLKDRERILFEAEANKEGDADMSLEVQYLLRRLKIKKLEEKAQHVLNELKIAESEAERKKAQELLEAYSQIKIQIETLKETK